MAVVEWRDFGGQLGLDGEWVGRGVGRAGCRRDVDGMGSVPGCLTTLKSL